VSSLDRFVREFSMERLGFFSEKLMDGMAKSGWSQKTTAVRLGMFVRVCMFER